MDYFFKLEELGELRFDGKKGKEFFFGFPHQKTSSISVKEKDNVWYDHAKVEGGDIIKAVQLFENKTFVEAINRLDKNTDIVADAYEAFYKKNGETDYNVSITKVLDKIKHPALLNYLESRGLELKTLPMLVKKFIGQMEMITSLPSALKIKMVVMPYDISYIRAT